MEEKQRLAEEFCKRNHLTLIICNRNTFGYADSHGNWWQMSYDEIALS